MREQANRSRSAASASGVPAVPADGIAGRRKLRATFSSKLRDPDSRKCREANRLNRALTKSHCRRLLLIAVLTASGAACGTDEAASRSAVPAATGDAECIDGGFLTVRLHGAIDADVDWRGAGLACEGMPRPDGKGARLRFSGALDAGSESRQFALIVALPDLDRGVAIDETPARLTLIEEDGGRFFTTGEVDACWSDVSRQEPLSKDHYAIDGIVYCVAPLAEVQGTAGVAFTELAFSGRVDWSIPE